MASVCSTEGLVYYDGVRHQESIIVGVVGTLVHLLKRKGLGGTFTFSSLAVGMIAIAYCVVA